MNQSSRRDCIGSQQPNAHSSIHPMACVYLAINSRNAMFTRALQQAPHLEC